jgi:LacI family transcriptional regulator/LacI family repressor for deo operon, udp, cdd, tsx, nupC, and nupG
MRQVAELAGVSVQTVSNHVNGRHQYMAEETRRRVAAAMRELKYHPNLTARGLRSSETRTLGFLVLDEHARFLADPLTDLIMAGIGDVAREENYGILIQSSTPSDNPDRLVKPVLESRVDGAFLLLSGDRAIRQAHIQRTADVTGEFLVFDEPISDPEIMSVRAADRDGGREMASHLIARGHRRIAFIGAAVPWAVVEQRFAGFNDAMRANGLSVDPELVKLEAGWEPATAVPIAERLLKLEDRPTAIMCSTDLLAIATIHAAQRLGLDVPGDVAVPGFDDFPFAHFARPALTTVRIPAYDMGREAARILINHLKGEGEAAYGAEQLEFPVELIVREST